MEADQQKLVDTTSRLSEERVPRTMSQKAVAAEALSGSSPQTSNNVFTETDVTKDASSTSADVNAATTAEVKEEPLDDVVDTNLNHDKIEADFKGVLDELSEDPTMSSFRTEYSKIHAALLQSHANERRLVNKCGQLQTKIASSSAQVASAQNDAAEAEQAIDNYKKEVEKAWRMVDIANERDQEANDTIEALQVEINRMRLASGKDEASASDKVAVMDRLTGARDGIVQERDEMLKEIAYLREQLQEVTDKFEVTEKVREEVQTKLENATQDLQLQKNQLHQETIRKERAEREARNSKSNIEVKENELKTYLSQLDQGRENLSRMEASLRDQKSLNEKTSKEFESLTSRYHKLQQEYENQLSTVGELMQENQTKDIEMKNREEQISTLRSDISKLTKQRDTLQRQLRVSEDKRQEIEVSQNALTAMVNRLEKEIELSKKQIETDKKASENLRHEKELLKKEIMITQTTSAKQQSLIRLHERAKAALEAETQLLKQANTDEKVVIGRLEKEREKCATESTTLKQKIMDLMEERKTKEMEVFNYKKKLSESESKLKQQQYLYETVSKEKDLYRKNLIESQNEVADMNNKMQITSHQVNRLKEENLAREAFLVKEQRELQHIVKEKENLVMDLDNLRTQCTDMKRKISTLETENRRLNKSIADGEIERDKLKKDIMQAMAERDMLGAQLIRRNSQLSLMYEKVRIQQSLLGKSEQLYRQRVEDINLLKTEVKRLRREKGQQNRSVHSLEEMRRELAGLHKEVTKERSKCRALEDELRRPQNVHRWRRLEGTDPDKYELILKIHALQRRLIEKTEEVVKRERDVQEKDKLYLELKKVLSRQPGPEVAEQLLVCQSTMRQKTRQMRSTLAELHMYEAQLEQYKCDHQKLTAELRQTRMQYLQQKKKLHQLSLKDQKQMSGDGQDAVPCSGPPPPPRVSTVRLTYGRV